MQIQIAPWMSLEMISIGRPGASMPSRPAG
jgi:hypothetical protein